jgi:hypothetical protein
MRRGFRVRGGSGDGGFGRMQCRQGDFWGQCACVQGAATAPLAGALPGAARARARRLGGRQRLCPFHRGHRHKGVCVLWAPSSAKKGHARLEGRGRGGEGGGGAVLEARARGRRRRRPPRGRGAARGAPRGPAAGGGRDAAAPAGPRARRAGMARRRAAGGGAAARARRARGGFAQSGFGPGAGPRRAARARAEGAARPRRRRRSLFWGSEERGVFSPVKSMGGRNRVSKSKAWQGCSGSGGGGG